MRIMLFHENHQKYLQLNKKRIDLTVKLFLNPSKSSKFSNVMKTNRIVNINIFQSKRCRLKKWNVIAIVHRQLNASHAKIDSLCWHCNCIRPLLAAAHRDITKNHLLRFRRLWHDFSHKKFLRNYWQNHFNLMIHDGPMTTQT